MAGDWIPMRLDLPDDPAVMEMAEILGIPEPCVVGYLHTIWSWASRHCNGGSVTGVTPMSLGRVTRCEKVPQAMERVGWLTASEIDGRPVVSFPNWERWMSQSAKSRALTSKRVAQHRAIKCNGTSVTESLPEKRREEKSNKPLKSPKGVSKYTADFETFWKAYPPAGRVSKKKAFAAWGRAIARCPMSTLMDAVEEYSACGKVADGFTRQAATWLNGDAWDDDRESWKSTSAGNGKGGTGPMPSDEYNRERERRLAKTRALLDQARKDTA